MKNQPPLTDSCTEAPRRQMSVCPRCHASDYHRGRIICNSGTSVPVNPLVIVLNGRHLKINVHHFMWTAGGCHDNRSCFCVKGGQLSLCQQGGGWGGVWGRGKKQTRGRWRKEGKGGMEGEGRIESEGGREVKWRGKGKRDGVKEGRKKGSDETMNKNEQEKNM